ncbi:hypothetical protein DWB67_16370 [Paracoccus sp. JM45]|nr:hypothetical protein [Paracoccus sp. JM45]RJE78659.1 hypothetical protein DWB67_16370 [Paracoccus sp. JM45]
MFFHKQTFERYYLYPDLAFTEVHKHRFDAFCAQFDTLLGAERTEGIRKLTVIAVAIFTGQIFPWIGIFEVVSQRQAQRFLSAQDQINLIFRPRRYRLSAKSYRHAWENALCLWADYAREMAS